ncbi:MAG: DUF4369 domain-containing protein [bacterium]
MYKSTAAWILLILTLMISCKNRVSETAVINGNFTDATALKLILQEMDTREIHTVDSIILDKSGKFTFQPDVKEPGFWLLKSRTGKILVMIIHPGDKIELSGNAEDFPDHITLKGPEESMMLNDFFFRTRLNELKVDSLEMLLVERQDSSDYFQLTQKLDTSFRQIWESQRTLEKAFIDGHPASLASLVVLNYAFGMSPVLSPEEDFNYYHTLDSALSIKYPHNKHVKHHHERVIEAELQMKSKKLRD